MFELSVAFKYLLPRRRQLSVSVIALLSVLVISLVVWLVVVFLSVTHGIEKRWMETLVAINAPVRLTPTDAYYDSYYYLIDNQCASSDYSYKTIGEKLRADHSDPYDSLIDPELSDSFPPADRHGDGSLKDPVKEVFALLSQHSDLSANDFEMAIANLRLRMIRPAAQGYVQNFLSQASYLVSFDGTSSRLSKTIQPLTPEDISHTFDLLSFSGEHNLEEAPDGDPRLPQAALCERLTAFFNHVKISQLKTGAHGWTLPEELYPKEGSLRAVALLHHHIIRKVIVEDQAEFTSVLQRTLTQQGVECVAGQLNFAQDGASFAADDTEKLLQKGHFPIVVEKGFLISSELDRASIATARETRDLHFTVSFHLQGISFSGIVPYSNLEIGQAEIASAFTEPPSSAPLWHYQVNSGRSIGHLPSRDASLGSGILLPIAFRENGILVGDRGFLSYYSPSPSALQEQRIPIYIAGFYDPGLMPMGGRLLLTPKELTTQIRAAVNQVDQMQGNGINVWFDDLSSADEIKKRIEEDLNQAGLSSYWRVETFKEYEFARPLLQQFRSDRTLFTLIALIIIVVACSNIISMLILLVNDKKKEIGILQSMGATPKSIALIFAACGTFMGVLGSAIGIGIAIFTLHHLDLLVNALSAIQGHAAFQTVFYGDTLPNELSTSALLFVLSATVIVSLLAGLIPALKATTIKPTEILRSE